MFLSPTPQCTVRDHGDPSLGPLLEPRHERLDPAPSRGTPTQKIVESLGGSWLPPLEDSYIAWGRGEDNTCSGTLISCALMLPKGVRNSVHDGEREIVF